MHPEARQYLEQAVAEHGPFDRVVEFGSLDINGGVRDLFGADYTGVDLVAGPGVDVVDDVASYRHPRKADCVVCCEVLEHTPKAAAIVRNAAANLKRGGTFIVTAASDPRAPHSAVDGGELRAGEFYRNVSAAHMRRWLRDNFTDYTLEVDTSAGDIRATATR